MKTKMSKPTDSVYFDSEMKNDDNPYTVIGCAMNVHNNLGCGFQEVIYQRALAIELSETNLSFTREQDMPVMYKEQQIGTHRVDFLVEGKLLVEIKAVAQLEDVHLV